MIYFVSMPTPHIEFKVNDHTLRYRPWAAFRALSEMGKLTAEVGESAVELLLSGDISQLTNLSTAGLSSVLDVAIDWIGAEDLGDRVKHYLDSCEVDARGESGDWAPLHGPDAAQTAADLGIGPLELLGAAWHCVKEGLRPLSDRLASYVAGRATSSQSDSTPNEKTD